MTLYTVEHPPLWGTPRWALTSGRDIGDRMPQPSLAREEEIHSLDLAVATQERGSVMTPVAVFSTFD
jgi:hypothetical protein